jgi:murein DD-endopeptidase MepM/ murein hydrolase activator NlpD
MNPDEIKQAKLEAQRLTDLQNNTTGWDSRGNSFTIPKVQPSVMATQLADPPQQVRLPQPKVPTQPTEFVQRLEPIMKQSQDGLIRAQTEEARRRDDVLDRLLRQSNFSSQSVYDNAFKRQGGDEFLKQLTDANTRLATLQGKFRSAAQAVSSAPGQSQAFEGVQLSEVGRQEAVEVGNQALIVQALQGNYDTARQIALDTAQFATQDRQIELQNLMAQFDALNGIVQGQEAQLIENARIQAEREYQELQRLQNTIDAALTSGGVSIEEMQMLIDPSLTNDEKLGIAQGVIARTAGADRSFAQNLQLEEAQLRRDQFELQQAQFREQVRQFGIEAALKERELSFNQALSQAKMSGELSEQQAQKVQASENALFLTGLVDELLNSPALKGSVGILNQITGAGLFNPNVRNFKATFEQLKSQLTLENLSKLKGTGAISDAEFKVLGQAATKLSLSLGEEAFRAELNKIRENLQRTIQQNGVTPDQAQYYYGLSGDDVSEVDSIYNQIKGYQSSVGRMSPINPNFIGPTIGGSSSNDFFKPVSIDGKKVIKRDGTTPYLQTLGAITGIDGSKYWKWGLDIDLKKGDKVLAPTNGTITAIKPGYNGGFGNQLRFKTDDGRELWFSHLDRLPDVKPGTRISRGQVIALGGNTGRVYSTGNGDGSHLDITMPKPGGGYYTAREVKAYLDQFKV